MTDQQAVAILREWARSAPCEEAAFQRGADAIEFNAWLFEPNPRGVLRIFNLWYGWNQQGDFRAYAEAQWRASRG